MLAAIVMSKKFRPIRLFFGVFGLTLQFFTFAAAQDLTVTLSVDAKRPAELRVSGVFTKERPANESHVLAFGESVAGVTVPTSRISSPTATDRAGNELQLITVPRCCIATGKIDRFSYKVDLESSGDIRAEAHASWLRDGTGVLMLGDLLPQEFLPSGKRRSAEINLELPSDWSVFSTSKLPSSNILSTEDIDNAVVFVGKGWNATNIDLQGNRFTVVTNGEFHFSQDEVQQKVRAIVTEYSNQFGSLNGERYVIALFRPNAAVGAWEADTRGRTAMIATTGRPFKSQTLQQLDEQLRHELFHLWIPNGVALSGSYDWFYEGFALYSALKLAVRSNTIRFEDMLDTMGRAFSAEGSVDLIQLSKQRYNGSEREMYAKGLVFAFLCDLAMNVASKGKRNSDTIVRELFRLHKLPANRVDGNEAVLKVLNAHAELRPLIERYVTGTQSPRDKQPTDAFSLLEKSGLDLTTIDGRSKLTVNSKLSSRQREILDKLGYNSWRKLVKDSK